MMRPMPYQLDYIADEYTAKIDAGGAVLARLRQSGFPVAARTAEDGVVEIESGDVNLEVYVGRRLRLRHRRRDHVCERRRYRAAARAAREHGLVAGRRRRCCRGVEP